jgi:hypothetical protein
MNPMAGELRVEKEEPKRRLSISQINLLSQCGEAYRRRYIMHHRTPSSVSLIVGGVVDRAVTKNLESKMLTGLLVNDEAIKKYVVWDYDKTIAEAKASDEGLSFTQKELLEGKEEIVRQGKEKSIRLSLLHSSVVAPRLNPLYLQRRLSIELPGYSFDVGGIIDIQEVDAVRDTKTKAKSPSAGAADDDDQLTMYAFLVFMNDGRIPSKLVLDCLVDTKIPKYVPAETTRTEEDFDVLLRRISVSCDGIDAGVFLPARESDWWCSESYCSFWKTCRYTKKKGNRPTV